MNVIQMLVFRRSFGLGSLGRRRDWKRRNGWKITNSPKRSSLPIIRPIVVLIVFLFVAPRKWLMGLDGRAVFNLLARQAHPQNFFLVIESAQGERRNQN